MCLIQRYNCLSVEVTSQLSWLVQSLLFYEHMVTNTPTACGPYHMYH